MGTYLLVSAFDPRAAIRAVASAPAPIDLCVTSPSPQAHETAAAAIGRRWVYTTDEPLLAARVDGESEADVVARYAEALRILWAYDAKSALVVCDELAILGDTMLVLDSVALARAADDLEQALPLP